MPSESVMTATADTGRTETPYPIPGDCKHCGRSVHDNYCARCGAPVTLKRIDGAYIVHEIGHLLHFEKGIPYTVKALFLRPGQSIRSFLTDDRNRLVKPVVFIIITSLLYTAIAHFFHSESGHGEFVGQATPAKKAIMSWVAGHYGYANIFMGILISLWLKLFYRKNGYNFFEIWVMLCFVMGMGMLVFAVFTLVGGIMGVDIPYVAAMALLLYCAWAIGQFSGGKKSDYLLALTAYILGMESFSLSASLLGWLIDSWA